MVALLALFSIFGTLIRSVSKTIALVSCYVVLVFIHISFVGASFIVNTSFDDKSHSLIRVVPL